MRMYETIFILQPDLGEEEIKGITERVQEIITNFKGNIRKLEDWGSRKLAYPINKVNRGRYYYLRFDGTAELIAELERRLRLNDKVLRYQSVKIEKEPEVPAAAEKPEVKEVAEEIAATEA